MKKILFTLTILLGLCSSKQILAAEASIDWISRLELNYPRDITIAGSYAYLSDYDSGLKIVDISDPTDLKKVGNYKSSGHTYALDIVGTYVYMVYSNGTLEIIDVSDPTDPSLIGTYKSSTEDEYFDDIDVNNSYAYIAAGANMKIIDISDPTSPSLVGTYAMASGAGSAIVIQVVDNYAYVGCQTYLSYMSNLTIFDVSDPTSAQLLSHYDLGNEHSEYINDIYAIDNKVYIAGKGQLLTLDVSNPTDPSLLSNYELADGNPLRAVNVIGSYAYVSSNSSQGLNILDITDSGAPELIVSSDSNKLTIGDELAVGPSGIIYYLNDEYLNVVYADLDGDGEYFDEISSVTDVSGYSEGKIKIDYADGAFIFKVFESDSTDDTIVATIDSKYLVLTPDGTQLALVDIDKLDNVDLMTITDSLDYKYNALKTAHIWGKSYAIITQKDATGYVMLSLVRVKDENLEISDMVDLTKKKMEVAKTKVKEKFIYLRNDKGKNLVKYIVSKTGKLVLD